MRTDRQVRSVSTEFKTREDGEELRIEGYFAVFDSNYEIYDGMTESIARGAFTNTLSSDVRALIDHDTRLVLGRNTVRTLELKQDERGLWGSVLINPNDQDAMNLYARVKRGDVNQCSFGFDILAEDYEDRGNGTCHWTIREVKLYEVSVVTFPAYEETNVSARKKDREEIRKRKVKVWKESMLQKFTEVE